MRLFVGGLLILLSGVSACAAISGLGDYAEGSGGDKSALSGPDADKSQDSSSTDDSSSYSTDDASGQGSSDADLIDDTVFVIVPADVNIDGPPPVCGPSNCGGCCHNGMCVGGQSVATCGLGGGACTDCTNKGGACTTAGQCATVEVDAAKTTTGCKSCVPCIPVYQSSCCKADNTCGCKTNFGGNGACN